MAAVIKIEVSTSGGLDDVKKDVADLGRVAEQSGGGFQCTPRNSGWCPS